MIDLTTREPVRVSTDGTAGPYIMVPVSQLGDIKRLLDNHAIPYWPDEDVISLNDEPEVAVINLGRGADAAAVQAILDGVS
ncbi:MAG TPA: hypothetical protein PLT20_12110 [Sedimentisphaerales bacterium]|nr:hypothetical protein [Sedimentisphaerales bacterium]